MMDNPELNPEHHDVQEEFVPELWHDPDANIIFIGDSLLENSQVDNVISIKEALENKNTDYKVSHLALGGARLIHCREWQIPALPVKTTATMFISIGGNDMANALIERLSQPNETAWQKFKSFHNFFWTDLSDVKKQITDIIEEMTKITEKVVIIVPPAPRGLPLKSLAAGEMRKMYKSWVTRKHNVALIDLDSTLNDEDISEDNIHPNDQGIAKIIGIMNIILQRNDWSASKWFWMVDGVVKSQRTGPF